MEVKAIARYQQISPRKCRLVADMVRGQGVEDALAVLDFTHKKAARFVAKTLRSAVANAENNNNLDVDSLFVKTIMVDPGPTSGRFRPRAQGRATAIRKRTSHITVWSIRAGTEVSSVGQKTHPRGFRLGVTGHVGLALVRGKNYATCLQQDLAIRKFLRKRLSHAGVPKIEIERAAKNVRVHIHTARPGIVIGKKGAEIEKLKQDIVKLAGKDSFVEIHEIRRPDLDAQLVAENIALQLERPRDVPPRDEGSRRARDAHGRARHPRAVRRSPRRPRDRAHRVVPRGPGSAAHAARGHPLRPGGSAHDVRRDRRQGLGLSR